MSAQTRRSPIRAIHLCVGLVAIATFPGCTTLAVSGARETAVLTPEQRALHNGQVFDSAWNLVRRGYYDRGYNGTDWEAAASAHREKALTARDDGELYDAINAMLAELEDDHTVALSRTDLPERQQQRALLGLIFRQGGNATREGFVVMHTLAGSAAANSGVQPGWVLISCDGQPPQDVLGPRSLRRGQVVRCEFLDHMQQRRQLDLTARTLASHTIRESRELSDGVLYLRFDEFDGAVAHWLRQELKEHHDARGVIVDLRFNPGGDAAALGRSLGEFFPRPVSMGRFITRRGLIDHLRAWSWFGSARYTGPLAVLVSHNSASSAEIFAAVIQHHRRGVVIGTPTEGAVLASRRFVLPDGGQLQLSINDYVSPEGGRLEGNGVQPDIVVRQTWRDLRAGRDRQLERALLELRQQNRAVTDASAPRSNEFGVNDRVAAARIRSASPASFSESLGSR